MNEPKSGSHWILHKDGFGVYPIPAGNGLKTEVADLYIRKLCEHFDIDEKAFRKEL